MCVDTALTEAYAFLFEGLLRIEGGWRTAARPEEWTRIRASRGFCGLGRSSIPGEVSVSAGVLARGIGDADRRYRELLNGWTGVEPDGRDGQFAGDLAFQAADYLRGWIAEAHLRDTCAKDSATTGTGDLRPVAS